MFSGGLDSSILASILAKILDPSIQLDLVNVSFDPDGSPDRISALFSYEDIVKVNPHRKIRLLCADYEIESALKEYGDHIKGLILPKSSNLDFNIAFVMYLGA